MTATKKQREDRVRRMRELAEAFARNSCSFCRKPLGAGRFVLGGDVRVWCSESCQADALERDEIEAQRHQRFGGR
jgi:hypothetical protein